MANDRIKVVGYATKQVYNGNIEYRNFSPDLVGNQNTDGNSTFTLGNFAITTSVENNPSKLFTTNKFSNFVSLCTLDLSNEESKALLNNNSEVKLKLDKTNLCNYAYFGSMLEYTRVSLEEIITKWPASLYLTPEQGIVSNNLTVENYNHDPLINESTFKVNVNWVVNSYQLNFLQNGTILDSFNETNDLRNLTVNYLSYSILNDDTEYALLGFTGSTELTNDYIYLRTAGNPFSNITGTSGTFIYHIKPNKLIEETFFNDLPDFESNLLNRLTTPKYTSVYKFPKMSEAGTLFYNTETITWPVTDGYNIDFNTTEYASYVNRLIDIVTNFDENKTNLMVRFLTSEAISDFDTVPRCDGEGETAGQKMNRTLKIYGREYDEIKRYIDGIQYANTVTYDQLNNTPDAILKYLAKTMGWGLVSSVLENDLLRNYVTSDPSTYSGMSRGYTAVEAEVEMWRRIILNTPWLWKSKGARKSIEFLFKFIGAPDGLIEFNEFIYVAKNTIDVDLFKLLLRENGLPDDIDLYNIDSEGYPRVPNNNPNMYFQKGGLWYRQTAGSGATIDIITGNNPHVGPYDGGAAFINQFNNLIPDFSAVTVSSTTTTTTSNNLFTNYKSGTINSYNGEYFVDVVSNEDVDLEDCVVVTTNKILDPYPTASEITECGCEVLEDDYALLIDITCGAQSQEGLTPTVVKCETNLVDIKETTYGEMVFIYEKLDEFGNPIGDTYTTTYISQECCKTQGGQSVYDETWGVSSNSNTEILLNAGYLCCKTGKCGCSATCDWVLATSSLSEMPVIAPYTSQFLLFQKKDGTQTAITPTGCSCIVGYTTPVSVTDPITGEVGIGCMLNDRGIGDLTSDRNVVYYTWYNTNSRTYEIRTWSPVYGEDGTIINSSSQPDNGFYSWIEVVYNARANGRIPCDQYMNNEIKIETGDDSSLFIYKD